MGMENLMFKESEDQMTYGKKRPTVYLCIGSDRLIFDCLGPIVGSMLKNNKSFNGYVYGTMAEPITALQVESAVKYIRRFHFGAELVVIDSAVGRPDEIGKIKCFNRGLRPALGVDKQMKVVGDRSVMGVVTTKDRVKNVNSCNVKLSSVHAMAEKIVGMILGEGLPFPEKEVV